MLRRCAAYSSHSRYILGRDVWLVGCGFALRCRDAVGERMQLLARLEAHSFSGCDADLGAGPGIAANPCLAGAYAENAKPPQLDALTGRQSFFQPLENRIHRGFSLGAGQPCALDHVMNDVLLNQSGYLAGATGKKCTTLYKLDGTDFVPFRKRRTILSMRKSRISVVSFRARCDFLLGASRCRRCLPRTRFVRWSLQTDIFRGTGIGNSPDKYCFSKIRRIRDGRRAARAPSVQQLLFARRTAAPP